MNKEMDNNPEQGKPYNRILSIEKEYQIYQSECGEHCATFKGWVNKLVDELRGINLEQCLSEEKTRAIIRTSREGYTFDTFIDGLDHGEVLKILAMTDLLRHELISLLNAGADKT